MKKLLSLVMGAAFLTAIHLVWAEDMGKMEGVSKPVAGLTPTVKQNVKKTKKKSMGKKTAPKVKTYVCPMDGSISDKPGKCPKCGMDLVEQEVIEKKKETKKEPTESKMDMTGNKFKSVSAEKFGVGESARICPVSGDEIEKGKGTEAILSNGKKIMLCCPRCQKAVEKNLKKYSSLIC